MSGELEINQLLDLPENDGKRWYLSGPMAGLPDHNYPAFNEATARLRERGHLILSPHELGVVEAWLWEQYLRRDVTAMMQDDVRGIVLLPGWEKSRGARVEAMLACNMAWPMFRYYPGTGYITPISTSRFMNIWFGELSQLNFY